MKEKRVFFTLIIGLMVIIAIFMVINKGRQPLDLTNALAAEIEIEPTEYDSAGVGTTSQFLMKTSTYIDPKIVAENISVEPEIKLSVEEQKSTGKILLIPEEPLEADEIYRFTLDLSGSHPLKWAFQTKGEFKINGTLPRDKSTGVPTNTGIEVAFSHANFGDADNFFEISPQAKGHFERHKKTAVFVPESLEPGTVYTVKVRKGLKLADSDVALAEDFVFQFETQDQAQYSQNKEYFEFFTNTMEFGRSTAPIIPLGYYKTNGDTAPEVKVSVYKYQDAGAYMQSIQERERVPYWAYFNRSQYLAKTKGLEQVQSFTANLKGYDGENFLEFPGALAPGYYLGEVALGSIVRQVWLQVSDLAVYTSVGENKILVWVNNLADGKPAVNASVALLGSEKKAVTDEKGMAEIPNLQIEDTCVYVTVNLADKETVVSVKPNWYRPMAAEKGEGGLLPEDFWKYFYLDRGLYKPDDTVHFWGLIKGREGDIDTPRQVTVALTKWQAGQDENAVLEEKQVGVEDNAFTGEMKLPDLIPGYYSLTVKLDDLIIIQQGFDVQTYTKPAYRIDVVPEQKALFAGDTMEFEVATTCFEETPVPKVTVKYNLDKSGELTTDAEGQAVLSYTPEYRSNDHGAVQYRYLYLNANLPESGEISTGTSVIVLNNDIDIKVQGEIRDKNGKINIEVDKLTVDKVNSGAADPWEEDAFVSGKGAGIPVTVSVFRQEWDQIEDGEYYDFINKVVVKKYRYNERRVLVDERQVVTDRNGKANFTFDAEDKKSYLVELKAQDAKDHQAKREIYLSGGIYPRYYGYSWYYLDDKNSDGKYAEGEEVLLTVKNNENAVPERAGGFLFYTAQRGIIDHRVQDTGSYKTIFTRKSIPNYWVKGVYFDGRAYHETNEYLAAFDETEKALDITISTDKTVYRPKDKVQVNLDVRDKEGRPVAATVNLNLVDEALFMLSPQQVDTLRSLYGDFLPSGILMTASTHNNPANYFGGGAEQGGEGGSGRQDFKDTAFFDTITTGKDGKASVSFTVPDNLTAWRLTYQAVTKDLLGASGTAKINVRLPFFVDMVLNDRYLAGDRPIINLRSLGTDLDEGREVAYHVEVTGGEKEVFDEKLTGKAFLSTPVSLPALAEGDYQITVTAIGAGQQDTLTRSFQVAESYLTQEKTDYALLTAESKIEAATKKPVTLTFADANWSRYLSALLSLAHVEGSRIEQKLVPQIAGELLKENYAQFEYLPLVSDEDLSPYQTQDGGIAILPYGSSDLEVSAKIAPWAKEHFDLGALEPYFGQVINDPKETRERGIIALYGLASLGEPVLQEVELAAKEKDLTIKEQLYVILALNQLGNEQPAGKMLKELIKTYGEANGPYMQINSGSDKDDLVKITGLAALAAERLMLDEGNMLHRYVLENPPQDELTYLEQIAFLQENLGKLTSGQVGFTYTIEGKKQQVELAPGETYSLVLTPEKLKLLSFDNIKGEVGITSLYQGAFTPSGENSSEGVSVTRDYQVAGKSTREFLAGDLVEVKVSWNIGGKAPSGVYRITDYLPSGLKLVEKPYNWNAVTDNLGWPVEVDGQKVVFLVSNKGTFSYYARIINQGSFTAENLTLQHVLNGKIYGITALDKVEIK